MGMLLPKSLGDFELELVMTTEQIFNSMMKEAVNMLKNDPKSFAETSGVWSTIENINNRVMPIACSLLALFFLIGFCENCIDVKEQLNLEMCLKLFIRIGISEYFVVNSLKIVLGLFDFATGLAGLSTAGALERNLIVSIGDDLLAAGSTGASVLLFPVLLLFMVVLSAAAVILITVFMRFIRIWIAIPYGTLAFSTISSGSHWLNGTVSAFLKYMLSVLLEAFSLGIALSIGMKLVIGNDSVTEKVLNSLREANNYPHFASAVLTISGAIISVIMILILVRTSQKIAGKALALDR